MLQNWLSIFKRGSTQKPCATKPRTLNTLPNELIAQVLDHLDITSLFAINQVNWHLHDLSLGHIYTTYSAHSPALFLRTIAVSPPGGSDDLARKVKHVSWKITNYGQARHIHTIRQVGLSPADRYAITVAFRRLDIATPEANLLVSRFAENCNCRVTSPHWLLEFFLLFLPNVSSLTVHNAWHWDDHVYWFTAVAASPQRFARLTQITVYGPMRLENAVLLLTLPALRDLELWEVTVMRQASNTQFAWDEPGHHVSDKLRNVRSGVERLALRKSYIPRDMLIPVLDAIGSLKAFAYEHKASVLAEDEEGIAYDVPPGVLAAALSRHAECESLCLLDGAVVDLESLDDLSTVVSPLSALKTLHIGPLQLRTLDEGAERFIEELVGVLPAGLRTFKVDFWSDYDCDCDCDCYGVVAAEAALIQVIVGVFAKAMQGSALREMGVTCGSTVLEEDVRQALWRELNGFGIKLLELE
jgi:hypothetical protein